MNKNTIILEMIVSGLFYGAWPILMNRSHLHSLVVPVVLGISSLAVVLSVVLVYSLVIDPKLWAEMLKSFTAADSKWLLGIIAGGCAAIGTLVFLDGYMKTPRVDIGKMFVIMLIAQTSVPVIYHIVVNQQINLKTAVGFGSAIVAIICLI